MSEYFLLKREKKAESNFSMFPLLQHYTNNDFMANLIFLADVVTLLKNSILCYCVEYSYLNCTLYLLSWIRYITRRGSIISNYLVHLIEVYNKASWGANKLKNVLLIHGIVFAKILWSDAQPNLIWSDPH